MLDKRVPARQARAELSCCISLSLFNSITPETDPEIYIVPISSILGKLPLVPAGDHGTITAAVRNSKSQPFEY